MSQLIIRPTELRDFNLSYTREWLVTNGIGGYASSTISGANTRRYHGLLVAALTPPVERIVMVAKLDEEILYLGENFQLGTNEFSDETISPEGYFYLSCFFLDGLMPVWNYTFADALLEKRLWMKHGSNTVFVQYSLLRASNGIKLSLKPYCTYRDFHSHNQGIRPYEVNSSRNGFSLLAYPSATAYHASIDKGEFEANPDWYWNFKHRQEQFRGLDQTEDLLLPGIFNIDLDPGETSTILFSADSDLPSFNQKNLKIEATRQNSLLKFAPSKAPFWIKQLFLAADQFIVSRPTKTDTTGSSIVAGYHWFSDWTRDTMLALPGLTLCTKRYELAAKILLTYSKFVSEGMLPNRFSDTGEELEYNSVDAALLYIYATHAYFKVNKDLATLKKIFPALEQIIEYYTRGTRFNIHLDQTDHLLFAGEQGLQLTWMDAKVGNYVVTPRIGKPVEVNALWWYALSSVAEIAAKLGQKKLSTELKTRADNTKRSFQKRFWNPEKMCLFDVVDVPDNDNPGSLYNDATIRPNQIIATGLNGNLLTQIQTKAVLDISTKALLTPYGLRSLDPLDKNYRKIYQGDQYQRDSSYHQGTVWPWLMGFYIATHLKVYKDTELALSYLEGFANHIFDAGLGTFSEIFDADPPHTPKGTIAQAWSVGEVIRAWNLCENFR